ncbi:hypothetical protein QTP88_014773 [Uroleucon formosanum]
MFCVTPIFVGFSVAKWVCWPLRDRVTVSDYIIPKWRKIWTIGNTDSKSEVEQQKKKGSHCKVSIQQTKHALKSKDIETTTGNGKPFSTLTRLKNIAEDRSNGGEESTLKSSVIDRWAASPR